MEVSSAEPNNFDLHHASIQNLYTLEYQQVPALPVDRSTDITAKKANSMSSRHVVRIIESPAMLSVKYGVWVWIMDSMFVLLINFPSNSP